MSALSGPPSPTAVAFGGPSPEHDVSILTGLQAARALVDAGRDVCCLYWSKTGDFFRLPPTLEAADFLDGVPRHAGAVRLVVGSGGGFVEAASRLSRPRPLALAAVLVCCHGGPGEDGSLQAALDLAGVSYSGPGPAAAALGLDKLAFAGLAAAAGLPVLPRRLLTTAAAPDFDGPYIVKPRFGGSSLGIDVVADAATATARLAANPWLASGAVVEPYRPDLFDVNIAVRTWPTPSLSAIERPLRTTEAASILGYADKYVGGDGMASAPRQLPADLPAAVADGIRAAALAVAELVDLRGVGRIDFLSDGDTFYLNEVNTIPGSLARYLFVDPPLPFLALLDGLLDEATARPTYRPTIAGADGAVLRSAGGIAAKLG